MPYDPPGGKTLTDVERSALKSDSLAHALWALARTSCTDMGCMSPSNQVYLWRQLQHVFDAGAGTDAKQRAEAIEADIQKALTSQPTLVTLQAPQEF